MSERCLIGNGMHTGATSINITFIYTYSDRRKLFGSLYWSTIFSDSSIYKWGTLIYLLFCYKARMWKWKRIKIRLKKLINCSLVLWNYQADTRQRFRTIAKRAIHSRWLMELAQGANVKNWRQNLSSLPFYLCSCFAICHRLIYSYTCCKK